MRALTFIFYPVHTYNAYTINLNVFIQYVHRSIRITLQYTIYNMYTVYKAPWVSNNTNTVQYAHALTTRNAKHDAPPCTSARGPRARSAR